MLALLFGGTAQAQDTTEQAQKEQGQKGQGQRKQQKQKQGQKVLFQPELFVGASHTDNALLVGEPVNDTAIYRMGAILPLTRKYPGGRFSLSYAPVYERFEDFDELNNLNHRADLDWSGKPSERSTVGLRARYIRAQDDRAANLSRPVPFLREPLARELVSSDLSFARRFAQRWNWSAGVGFSDWSFEPIEEDAETDTEIDPETDPPTDDFEDRQETRARIGLSWGQTPGFKVGGQYAVRRFDLDVSGDETAHLVSLTVDGATEDRFKLSFGVGGFLTEDDSDKIERIDESDDSERGAQGWLTLSQAFTEHTLSLTLSHRPSVGGTRRGTAEISTAELGLYGSAGDAWEWAVFGRYGRREPRPLLAEERSEIEIFGADGYVERRFRKIVGLRLGAGYAEQSADNPIQEGEVFRGNLTLVLYPLARTRLGGDTPDSRGYGAGGAAALD